jgi:hemolysin activation/secretion protein
MKLTAMPLYFFVLLGLIPTLCIAQPPDAGQILRQQELNTPKIDRLPPPEIFEPEVLDAPAKGVTILVKSIVISGGESLENHEVLQALVADSVGQTLDFSQLQKLTDRISQHLKAKGWLLTKAYLPKQDVTDGNIHINITQGQLEINDQGQAITIERAPDTRIDDDIIQERMRYIISDNTLQGDKLERTLLLLNDLPGIQAKTSLEKGKKAGTSRLGLNVKESDLIKGNATIDDTGSHYTGTWVGNLNVNISDAFGKGEQISLGGTGAENMAQGRISFSAPIGYNGLQINSRYSYLDYSVGRELKNLNSTGVAQTGGVGLSYPFIRSRDFSLWGSADYAIKDMHDSAANVVTSEKQIHSGKLGINGQALDKFLGGGLNQFSFDSSLGNVDLFLEKERAADLSTAKSLGIYEKHNFNFTRLQKITDSFSLYASTNGQFAYCNLSSAEKFVLGGSSGVRAYPSGEASGDSGYVANFEMRYDVPYKTDIGSVQLVGFFDTGYIVQHETRWKNDVSSKSGRNEYNLHGSGIGVNFSHGNAFSIRGTWAHTIGDNPGLGATSGNDSSGSHDENRFLVNTAVYF